MNFIKMYSPIGAEIIITEDNKPLIIRADLYPAPLNMIGGTKWGYINEDGKFIIRPSYDSASNFQENGLAVVGVGSLYGIIDHNKNYIVSPKYNFISEFSNNRAVVMDDKGFNIFYISKDGLYIYFYPYDIGPYSAGFPTFKILYKDIINIIDLKGDFWRSFN